MTSWENRRRIKMKTNIMRSFSYIKWGWVIISMFSLPLANTTCARHFIQTPHTCPILCMDGIPTATQTRNACRTHPYPVPSEFSFGRNLSGNPGQSNLSRIPRKPYQLDGYILGAVGVGGMNSSSSGNSNSIPSSLDLKIGNKNELERARVQAYFDRNSPDREKEIHSYTKVPLALMASGVVIFLLLCWLALWVLKKRYS